MMLNVDKWRRRTRIQLLKCCSQDRVVISSMLSEWEGSRLSWWTVTVCECVGVYCWMQSQSDSSWSYGGKKKNPTLLLLAVVNDMCACWTTREGFDVAHYNALYCGLCKLWWVEEEVTEHGSFSRAWPTSSGWRREREELNGQRDGWRETVTRGRRRSGRGGLLATL